MFTGTLNPVSNRATWTEDFELTDLETGDPIDLSTATEITIELRDPSTQTSKFTLSMTGGEIDVVALGVFEWRAEVGTMRNLCGKTYEVGCTIEQSGDTTQLIIGRLPVVDGIVS